MRINWQNLLSLIGILLLLINFASIKQYIRSVSLFSGLKYLPEEQRVIVVIGIILVSGLIIRELRNTSG